MRCKAICKPMMIKYPNSHLTWWRHQMETFSAVLAICAGNSPGTPHKGQWRGALMFSLVCVWINNWVNDREAGDLRCYRGHYDITVMIFFLSNLHTSCIMFHNKLQSNEIWLTFKHSKQFHQAGKICFYLIIWVICTIICTSIIVKSLI